MVFLRYVFCFTVLLTGCNKNSTTPSPQESSSLQTQVTCPICGSKLTTVGAVTDDTTQPSKNLCIWNRSICANQFYNDQSSICGQCWSSHFDLLNCWERSSELPASFHHPLAPAIANIPLPPKSSIKSLVVYSQKMENTKFSDSVHFWCVNNADTIQALRKYAEQHDLFIKIDEKTSPADQVTVEISNAKQDKSE
jgi:hypothetical protein